MRMWSGSAGRSSEAGAAREPQHVPGTAGVFIRGPVCSVSRCLARSPFGLAALFAAGLLLAVLRARPERGARCALGRRVGRQMAERRGGQSPRFDGIGVVREHLFERADRSRVGGQDADGLNQRRLVLLYLTGARQLSGDVDHIGMDVGAQEPQRLLQGHERLFRAADAFEQQFLRRAVLEKREDLQCGGSHLGIADCGSQRFDEGGSPLGRYRTEDLLLLQQLDRGKSHDW